MQAHATWHAGRVIHAADPAVVAALPPNTVLEATCDAAADARHACMAIKADHHVVMVTKKTNSVGRRSCHGRPARGRVIAPLDGDQPNLPITLLTWAQVIRLSVITAGRSSEYDVV